MISIRGLVAATALVAVFLLMMNGLAPAHDIYTDWKIPGTGASCCSDKDCRPVKAKFENGQWWAHLESGEWLAIPPARVIKEQNPDGKAHLCETGGYVFCFLPEEGGV